MILCPHPQAAAVSSATIVVMKLKVELERESDGRWIGEIADLPGVLAYGGTREEALAAVEALALRVIADRIENGEIKPQHADVLFEAA